jgi:hypothetical protein
MVFLTIPVTLFVHANTQHRHKRKTPKQSNRCGNGSEAGRKTCREHSPKHRASVQSVNTIPNPQNGERAFTSQHNNLRTPVACQGLPSHGLAFLGAYSTQLSPHQETPAFRCTNNTVDTWNASLTLPTQNPIVNTHPINHRDNLGATSPEGVR